MGNNSVQICVVVIILYQYEVVKKVHIQYKAQCDISQTFVCFISFRVPQWPDDWGKIKAREDTEDI